MTIELLNPIDAILKRAGPRIWACERPPTEKAPLESVVNCRKVWVSHAAGKTKRTWIGLIMARNYKRLGGIINASAGPAKAQAVFAESFGILRENVVNLRENPVSSLRF